MVGTGTLPPADSLSKIAKMAMVIDHGGEHLPGSKTYPCVTTSLNKNKVKRDHGGCCVLSKRNNRHAVTSAIRIVMDSGTNEPRVRYRKHIFIYIVFFCLW